MTIFKTLPVALAAMFSLAAAGAAYSQGAPSQGVLQAGGEQKTVSYRHHDRGRGDMRDDRRSARGFNWLIEAFDANDDGGVTQEEILMVRRTRLSEFDANNDGKLDLSEYEALWLDAMREQMVDRFQAHDDDGDGSVTIEEFSEDYANIVERRDRNGDGVLNSDDLRRPSQDSNRSDRQ